MSHEGGPDNRRPKQPDQIKGPEELKSYVALFREIEIGLATITPDKYIRPDQEPLRNVKVLGAATDKIKQLYSLHQHLRKGVSELDSFLRSKGVVGNEEKLEEINRLNLQQRAVAIALGYEVGAEFKSFGAEFGIDATWNVFTQKEE